MREAIDLSDSRVEIPREAFFYTDRGREGRDACTEGTEQKSKYREYIAIFFF